MVDEHLVSLQQDVADARAAVDESLKELEEAKAWLESRWLAYGEALFTLDKYQKEHGND